MTLIIALKDVLVCEIPEDGDSLVQNNIYLGIRFLYSVSSQACRTEYMILRTPLRPFFKFSSMKRDMNSGAFSWRLMNVSKAYQRNEFREDMSFRKLRANVSRIYLVDTAFKFSVILQGLGPYSVKLILESQDILNPLECHLKSLST